MIAPTPELPAAAALKPAPSLVTQALQSLKTEPKKCGCGCWSTAITAYRSALKRHHASVEQPVPIAVPPAEPVPPGMDIALRILEVLPDAPRPVPERRPAPKARPHDDVSDACAHSLNIHGGRYCWRSRSDSDRTKPRPARSKHVCAPHAMC